MKCQKCSKLFSSFRKPVIFPCGHSFCGICFQQQTVAVCPMCGEEGKIVVNYALYEEIVKNKNNHIQKYIKVCLFGNADVGKSSLIKRIVDDEFEEFINPTIGIDFRYKDAQVANSVYRFQLWDSAGQEKYRSMVTQHLKGSDIVLLLYDVTVQPMENSLEYWFKEIENNTTHSNIIVIGNKMDEYRRKSLENFQSMTEKEQEIIHQKKWKDFKISCKTNENVKELFDYVVDISKKIKTKAQQKKQSVILTSNIPKKQPSSSSHNPHHKNCSC